MIDTTSQSTATSDVQLTEENSVKLWRKRVKDAKSYFDKDFKRMKEDMEFAANIQWEGDDSMDVGLDARYKANFITNHVNNKVAALYAKNPKCEAQRRDRLDFAVWDGTVEQEQQATMAVQSAGLMGMMTPQAAQAGMLLQDIQQGRAWQKLCDRVGKTLEILYGYQCDTQSPTFKKQMKQLVRRVVTCGVGYVRLNYVNNFAHMLSSSLTDDSLAFRVKRAKAILAGISEDKIPENDPRVEQLKLLFNSVQSSIQQGDMTNIEERLEFDFPSATSIIVDPRCKALKGFIGAEWVAQEYLMPLDAANAYFELRGDKAITTGKDFVSYADDGLEMPEPSQNNNPEDPAKTPLGCFWEIFDLTTKTSFFICDGWPWYVQDPAPLDPCTNNFWPLFSLTFNDIEVVPGQKVHIYPPSDVQLLKPMQKERNRTRQELKEHRQVNRPFFAGLASMFEQEDLVKFARHETGEFIKMKSSLMGANGQQNVENAIFKWEGIPIDRNVYDTTPLDQDAQLAVGSNQIQQGGSIKHTAATPAVIQEQARISGVSSNVDDLDDLLSDLAQAGGEIILRKFSPQTVQRIAGRGAVFPDQQREDFLNEVYLDIIAASSGRPNKAVDVQNAMQIIPIMMQNGANPWACIEYLVKVMDANLDPTKFAPMVPPMMPMQGGQQPQQQLQPGHPHPGNVGQQRGGQAPPPGVQMGGQH